MTTTLSSANSGDSVVGSCRERVDRGAAEPAVADRVGERLLVDDAAAPGVDRAACRASRARAPPAFTSPMVSRRLGRVDRHEVAGRDELFDRGHELHAELARAIGAHERVVRDEPHAERVRALGDEHADAAEADDAERLAVQLDALPLRAVPLPGLEVGVRLRHVARLREQQRERVLGRREDVRLRRVDDHHAAPRRLGDVDVVEADAGPADDDEVGARGEHLGGDLRRAADHQRGRARRPRPSSCCRREAGLHVDVEAGGAHRVEPAFGERFGDEDAGGHDRRRETVTGPRTR